MGYDVSHIFSCVISIRFNKYFYYHLYISLQATNLWSGVLFLTTHAQSCYYQASSENVDGSVR